MPRRAIDPGLVARMNVGPGPAPPALAARDQLELDYALGAEIDADVAIDSLRSKWHEDAATDFEGGLDFGLVDYLGKVRGPDLFLALGDEDEIDRQLEAGSANSMKCSEESSLGSLLIDGAPAYHHFSEPGLVDNRGGPRWGRPFGWIHLLDVVHKVHADRTGGAGIESCEYAGLAIRGNLGDLAKSGVPEQT